MNENYKHDKALEDAIERVVHGKKASGNELLDTLGSTKPKADSSFMANLEERLMAEFASKEKEKMMMKRKERPSKFGRWPLTMAAAVMAILLVGGFAFLMQGGVNNNATMLDAGPFELTATSIIQTATAMANPSTMEATEIPMIPVVIAIQDIPEGAEITHDMIELILFPVASAPSGAYSEREDVVGQYARTTIYREEIVLARKIYEVRPFDLTATAILANVNEVDPFDLTATAIIAVATAQAQAGCALPDAANVYQVKEGDTLFSIAEEFDLTVSEIITANCLQGIADIAVGDYLHLPISSEEDTFALTATAMAQAVVNRNPDTAVMVVPNAPEAQGCDANTRLYQPMNGQVIDDTPIIIRAIAQHDDFAQAKLEIAGASTNGEFVVIANIILEALSVTDLGQFVPSMYEDGEYQMRLQTFSTLGHLVAYCTITVYLSDAPMRDDLTPVVMALDDIPLGTIITEEMLRVVYWPQDIAMEYASANAGQWFVTELDSIVGKQSRTYIPALTPISDDWYGEALDDGAVAILPNDKVAIAIPNLGGNIQASDIGKSMDIIAAMRFVDADAEGNPISGERTILSYVVVDAQVLWVGAFPPNEGVFPTNDIQVETSDSDELVTLAVSPEDATMISWLIEADIPMLVVPHLEGAEVPRVYNTDETGMFQAIESPSPEPYFVAIPFDQIQSIAYGVAMGDTVSLLLGSTMAIEGTVGYIGGAQYAPTNMQTYVENFRPENTDVLVLEVSSAEELATISRHLSQGLSFELLRQDNTSGIAPMQAWFDASALNFSIGQKVDVIGQFIYLNAEGQFEGMISQRIGLSMTVVSIEAGTGEMAAYALVGLDVNEEDLALGQMIYGFQTYLNPANSQVLETWSLVPYNPDLGASISYFSYNGAEPIAVDASTIAEGKHYTAIDSMALENLSGGFSVGDAVKIHLGDGSFINGQISYVGWAIYAPFEMQAALDELRAGNTRVVIFEVTNAEDADAVHNTLVAAQSISIERP